IFSNSSSLVNRRIPNGTYGGVRGRGLVAPSYSILVYWSGGVAMLTVGTKAPLFAAESTKGRIDLQTFIGKKKIVLIFYPGDDTPVCTKQLCAIRDRYSDLEAADAVVIGINPADLTSHRAFSGKFGYDFPLIADGDHAIRKAYGVGKVLGFLFQQRIVYIIDKHGMIAYARKGNPAVTELLQVVNNIP
ncbi:peroxiredoxin, partial [Brevibacillus borstelensis]